MTSAASLLLKSWEAAVALSVASAIALVEPAAATSRILINVALPLLTAPHSCKPSGRGCEMPVKLGDDQARARLR